MRGWFNSPCAPSDLPPGPTLVSMIMRSVILVFETAPNDNKLRLTNISAAIGCNGSFGPLFYDVPLAFLGPLSPVSLPSSDEIKDVP